MSGGATITDSLERARAHDARARAQLQARDDAAAAAAWTECAILLRAASASIDLQLADVLEATAAATGRAGDPARGRVVGHEAVAHLRRAERAGQLTNIEFASRIGRFGLLFCAMQHWPDAVALLGESEALFSDTPDLPPPVRRERMQVLGALAVAHRFAGTSPDAVVALSSGAAWAEACFAGSTEIDDRVELAQWRNSYGDTLLHAGLAEQARQVLTRCAADTAVLADDVGAPGLRNLHAAVLNKLGRAAAASGDRALALRHLEASVDAMRRLVEQDGLTQLDEDLRAAIEDLRVLRET